MVFVAVSCQYQPTEMKVILTDNYLFAINSIKTNIIDLLHESLEEQPTKMKVFKEKLDKTDLSAPYFSDIVDFINGLQMEPIKCDMYSGGEIVVSCPLRNPGCFTYSNMEFIYKIVEVPVIIDMTNLLVRWRDTVLKTSHRTHTRRADAIVDRSDAVAVAAAPLVKPLYVLVKVDTFVTILAVTEGIEKINEIAKKDVIKTALKYLTAEENIHPENTDLLPANPDDVDKIKKNKNLPLPEFFKFLSTTSFVSGRVWTDRDGSFDIRTPLRTWYDYKIFHLKVTH